MTASQAGWARRKIDVLGVADAVGLPGWLELCSMNATVLTYRSRIRANSLTTTQDRERWERRRVSLVWGLLFLNVLTFADGTWSGQPLIIPIPSIIGKLITQGALPLAFLMALTVNRRLRIRPNLFLSLLVLLVIAAVVSAVDPAGHLLGTMYRTCRLAGFVATLWLISPWFGRRDLLLLKTQLVCLGAVLVSVAIGLMIAPGRALAESRLSGVIWPSPPTQVADFAAVTAGLLVLLWLCGIVSGRIALLAIPASALLLLTHSRTEVVALMAGIFVAGLGIFTARARVRKAFATAALVLSVAITAFSGVLTAWLIRDENTRELTTLTGRTSVWTAVAKAPRDEFQVIFGFGLSNKSFNGLPVDSNWFAAYLDLGLVGVALSAILLLLVLVSSYFQPAGNQRALALFLATYLIVNSVTATGLSDASVALLELTLAASLLVPTASERQLVH